MGGRVGRRGAGRRGDRGLVLPRGVVGVRMMRMVEGCVGIEKDTSWVWWIKEFVLEWEMG